MAAQFQKKFDDAEQMLRGLQRKSKGIDVYSPPSEPDTSKIRGTRSAPVASNTSSLITMNAAKSASSTSNISQRSQPRSTRSQVMTARSNSQRSDKSSKSSSVRGAAPRRGASWFSMLTGVSKSKSNTSSTAMHGTATATKSTASSTSTAAPPAAIRTPVITPMPLPCPRGGCPGEFVVDVQINVRPKHNAQDPPCPDCARRMANVKPNEIWLNNQPIMRPSTN